MLEKFTVSLPVVFNLLILGDSDDHHKTEDSHHVQGPLIKTLLIVHLSFTSSSTFSS